MTLEKRARKRQKLLSMKRYSSLLKRPEILETVYSVESEDGNEQGVKGEPEKKVGKILGCNFSQ